MGMSIDKNVSNTLFQPSNVTNVCKIFMTKIVLTNGVHTSYSSYKMELHNFATFFSHLFYDKNFQSTKIFNHS